MIINTVEGDLISLWREGKFDAIAHGCNCFNTMKSGVAGEIARQYPIAVDEDDSTERGDFFKLGSLTEAKTSEGSIYNLYTQFYYGTKERHLEYGAVRDAFTRLNSIWRRGDILGIPKIGAGLAGGHWNTIQRIIDYTTPDIRIILVEYKP